VVEAAAVGVVDLGPPLVACVEARTVAAVEVWVGVSGKFACALSRSRLRKTPVLQHGIPALFLKFLVTVCGKCLSCLAVEGLSLYGKLLPLCESFFLA